MIELYDRYHLPLMVVENGLGAKDEIEEDGSIHYNSLKLNRNISSGAILDRVALLAFCFIKGFLEKVYFVLQHT